MCEANGLAKHYENWKNYRCISGGVLNWVRFGVPLTFDTEPREFELSNRHLQANQRDLVTTELSRLEQCGLIEKCSVKPKCCSPLSCVPKKGGKIRLITDLRLLNTHCQVPKFNNEDIRVVEQYIQHNDCLATVGPQRWFLSCYVICRIQNIFRIQVARHLLSVVCSAIRPIPQPSLFCQDICALLSYVCAQTM